MADADGETSILEDIKAAQAELRGDEPIAAVDGPESADLTETAQQMADRERDEAGRFKAKTEPREKLTLPKPAKEAPLAAAPVLEGKLAPTNGLPPEIDKDGKHLERIAPPASWKGAAKVSWDRLPRPVREEIAREYGEVDTARGELAPLKEMFDVNREFLVNQAGSVPNAMAQMMQFARLSVDNPVQLAEHILRSKGLDPRAVFGGQQTASAQGQQPDLQAFIAQQVSQALQPYVAQTEQQQTQQIQSTIAAFAADSKHPYFNDVRSSMGVLLKNGTAKSMDEAYDMATWANPTIRATLISAQAGASGEQQQQVVQRARLAGRTNLKGSPLPNGTSVRNGAANSSVLDDVRAAAEELRT